ncbi:MAG: phosphoribosylanthranilate isomerase [Paludibacteraceae bacterium]|nr:phosphoribosylanthranilate isomerase [Paludibacteraceae bacterium]
MKTKFTPNQSPPLPEGVGGRLLIKVCGMRNSQNIADLAKLNPDYMGFIFYAKSPRYAASLNKIVVSDLPATIQKVGVFVNESIEKMHETALSYGLDVLQLHGNETTLQCIQLQEEGFTIIKAFPIAKANDFENTCNYESCCDYFLFDTKTTQKGGSGIKFDWELLKNYQGKTPFFLSGGIDLEDVETIKKIAHPKLYGLDINSKFETEPGLKDINKLKKFIKRLEINDKI